MVDFCEAVSLEGQFVVFVVEFRSVAGLRLSFTLFRILLVCAFRLTAERIILRIKEVQRIGNDFNDCSFVSVFILIVA